MEISRNVQLGMIGVALLSMFGCSFPITTIFQNTVPPRQIKNQDRYFEAVAELLDYGGTGIVVEGKIRQSRFPGEHDLETKQVFKMPNGKYIMVDGYGANYASSRVVGFTVFDKNVTRWDQPGGKKKANVTLKEFEK